MKIDKDKVFKTLNPNKVWIPILFGVGIVGYLFYQDDTVTVENLSLIFTAEIVPVMLAFLVLFARDVGYVYRIRTITGEKLTWKSSIYVIILWEFASAVTPSVVGGTAVAVFILMKEGIKLGKALAYTMITAIFDNLYFVVMAPIIFFIANGSIFPQNAMIETQLGRSLPTLFFVSYGLIAIYTLVMAFAVLVNPRWFKWILLRLTSIKWLRKWRPYAYEQGNEIMIASRELRGRDYSYWFKITFSTMFIWTARYAMLNCVIEAFTNQDFAQHLTIFARQVIIWITMLISPTPGSSGTAEFIFNQFFREDLGSVTFVSNIFWRLMTYYPYLFLGALILPRWIARVFKKKK
ncbi:flippase-like domain-containing protein [Marivirga sp. S37H4]|uniref:Flippase-like domain-containing protein n=1 Tax=Marivirga aurantiaca TaxID=2802615 RepID=A0A934X0W8_9BACT|nr:lysylphosphatidylglycerol synthase transmembrane domain-containing protein [Marivirga aurantiaca]MBK6266422.1 flippase-like domain-containing protein [Marivirga aurantiaca]